MMFITHFNNISVLSWLSVLLVEETGVRKSLTNCSTSSCIQYTPCLVYVLIIHENKIFVFRKYIKKIYRLACLKSILLSSNYTNNGSGTIYKEEFEDTKGAIRIRISKKNRQQNGQKEKVQKDKQRSTKHTYKTKDRVTRTPVTPGDDMMCSGRVNSSCSTMPSP